MSRNVEIKARASDWDAQKKTAAASADRVETLEQEDVFYPARNGRLKLRGQGDAGAYLIAYSRPDEAGAKTSDYVLAPVADFKATREALSRALGEEKVVRKKRTVFHWRQTRVHFDEVEGLGKFIELEVVLRPDQDAAFGEEVADFIMNKLGIAEGDLIQGAYADL